jgi:ferredoxin-NADP reductase
MSRRFRTRLRELAGDLGQLATEQASAQAMRLTSWGADHARTDWAGQTRAAVAGIHPPAMELELVELRQVSPSTRSLRFARRDGRLPPFLAGQHVSLAVEIEGVRTARPYSISSAPEDPLLELTLRDDPDGFVAPWLYRREPGWSTRSSGPVGTFHHEPLRDAERLVFVAGGTGITPFLAMLRQAQAQGWPRPITLIYGNRRPDDVPFGSELRRMARKNPSLRVVFVYSDAPDATRVRKGFIDRALIADVVDRPGEHSFFLCGPEPMLALVRGELEALGLAPRRVRSEDFGPPQDITRQAGWPPERSPADRLELCVEDQRIPALAGEPLLVALERAGLAPRSTCRTGACGDCRVRLLSGRVLIPEGVALRRSDREHGFVHACMAWPLEDCTLGPLP